MNEDLMRMVAITEASRRVDRLVRDVGPGDARTPDQQPRTDSREHRGGEPGLVRRVTRFVWNPTPRSARPYSERCVPNC